MKALLYRMLLLAGWLSGLALPATAQNVPNNTLNTWETRNGIEVPTSWLTIDDALPFYGLTRTNTGAVTKSTNAHSTPYAASLTNVALGGYGYPGTLYLGTRFDAYYGLGGAPYTTRPSQMQFYYQSNGPVADSAYALVLLTSTQRGVHTEVGAGEILLPPTTGGYTQLTVPITYFSSAVPDSIRLTFTSSIADLLTLGTTLLIDDITLSGSALAVRADAAIQDQLTVSPNPSPAGHFQLNAPSEPALASAPLTVLDVMGRVVAQQPALALPSSTRDLNLSSLSTGIYILRKARWCGSW